MHIDILPKQTPQACWQVNLDSVHISFRNEREARQFVSTLQNRLNAPHNLPKGAQSRTAL